ncbi:MAG: 2,3-bisphosphoglycerate-independent phosphoglycerate mutase [Christensenellaceae bacterium]|nr:2,3-bisphosphoglycerate-independent phosphoglycerate mutase [Christensenellaceae bacterium]
MESNKKLTALIIMDGLGERNAIEGNAVKLAGTPNLDRLKQKYPWQLIGASGMDVGLPDGQMGNSEVGHLNIGAGRIVYQELTRISRDIETGVFFENEALLWAMDKAKKKDAKLHLIGLLSDGGVHSHITHLFALLNMAKQKGIKDVLVHCLLDGRDVAPDSGIDYIRQLEHELARLGVGRIATVQGRYYGMDRDNIWDRVKLGYDAIALGEGVVVESAEKAVLDSYAEGVMDEFVLPVVIPVEGKTSKVESGDSIIFYNFRPDRARQLTRAFTEKSFNSFERQYIPTQFVTMTRYDETLTNLKVVNPPEDLTNTFGDYISSLGKTQLRIAETQKYAHVTFFFSGGNEEPVPGEDRILIDSDKEVPTFDKKPEMSAPEVTEEALKQIRSGKYDVMILNFANCDMVGHTGILDAAVQAVKEVDKDVGILVDEIIRLGGVAFVTADHGNAEQMFDENGGPFTAHTTNPVPFIACGEEFIGRTVRSGGKLCDIAPTMLKAMGLQQPTDMTGAPLI